MKNKYAYLALALASAIAVTQPVQAASAPKIDCASVNLTGKTSDEVSRIQQLCQLTEPTPSQTVTPDEVRQWASLGKEFATAVTETARGLGVTVNEFLLTPAGALVALYFLWDLIGGILIGVPMLIATWILFAWFVNRFAMRYATYEYQPVLFGLFTRKVVIDRYGVLPEETRSRDVDQVSSENLSVTGIAFVVALVCTGISMATIF